MAGAVPPRLSLPGSGPCFAAALWPNMRSLAATVEATGGVSSSDAGVVAAVVAAGVDALADAVGAVLSAFGGLDAPVAGEAVVVVAVVVAVVVVVVGAVGFVCAVEEGVEVSRESEDPRHRSSTLFAPGAIDHAHIGWR